MVEMDDGTKEIEITTGVAQGSVGGPTIWNIYYEALLRLILPKDVVLVGYADNVAQPSTREEMCVPVSVRVSVRACVCERVHAER